MNLRQLGVLHAIMRSGSITGAARLLNVSQPAVSMTLRQIEDQLAIKLFTRNGGQLLPTPEADALYPDLDNIFERVNTINRATQNLVRGWIGAISMATTPAIANGYLAEAVTSFLATRPDLRISIQALPSAQVIEKVVRREVDFGISHAPARDRSVEADTLVESVIHCIIPADHQLARCSSVKLRDLLDHDIITYPAHTVLGGVVDNAFRSLNLAPRTNVQVNFARVACLLASAGAGVALVEPFEFASRPIPGLVSLPLIPSLPVRAVLVFARERPQSRAAQEFVAQLRAMARKTGFAAIPRRTNS